MLCGDWEGTTKQRTSNNFNHTPQTFMGMGWTNSLQTPSILNIVAKFAWLQQNIEKL